MLKPYDLQSIGMTLAVASLAAIVGNLVYTVYKIVTAPRSDPLDYRKMGITGAVVAVLAIAALAIPLPLHEETAFLIEPTDVAKVYATTPGRVSEVLRRAWLARHEGAVAGAADERRKGAEATVPRDGPQLTAEGSRAGPRALEDQAQEEVAKRNWQGSRNNSPTASANCRSSRSALRATASSWRRPAIPEPAREDVRAAN